MSLEVRRLVGAVAVVSVAAVSFAASGIDLRAAAAGSPAPVAQAPAQRPGQAQPQATPSQPAGEAAQKPPTFQVEVNLVTTDVIARDRNGQFVANLDQKEIEVYEDGVKQTIASMTLVHGGRVINQLQPPPPPVQEGIVLPPTRPQNDTAGRIFLIVVDDLHLDFQNTGRIRELFKKISQQLIHEGDMFGIVSTGPSSLAIDLTYDRRRLDEAIKKISGAGLKPTEIIEAPSGADGPSEVRYRAHVAFSTAYDLLRNLERVQNRRKAIIYVSNGYDFNPFPESRYEANPLTQMQGYADDASYDDPFARQGQQFADADLARELAELTRQANRANATIYTIDPRGLVGGPGIDENLDTVEWGNYIRKSQDSLRVIADLTGGIAVINQNDFDRALKRIDAETSDYYMLGYYSSNPDPTRRTRKVEVKTTRDGVSIWARSSYSLKRPGQGSK
ncbi:MAG: VWA domain-containing protein [Vicinamibacteraceae bacterium]|nr:VWA domain-containing protein [Vicinamibacteraceae bacterium]